MEHSRDKRTNRRIAMEAGVEIEVIACTARPDMKGHRCAGRTRDVALCGLQLETETSLPEGAVVEIVVQLEKGEKPFTVTLTGDVIWTDHFFGNKPVAGVFLRDRPRQPMRVWMDTITEQLSEHCSTP